MTADEQTADCVVGGGQGIEIGFIRNLLQFHPGSYPDNHHTLEKVTYVFYPDEKHKTSMCTAAKISNLTSRNP